MTSVNMAKDHANTLYVNEEGDKQVKLAKNNVSMLQQCNHYSLKQIKLNFTSPEYFSMHSTIVYQ